jgi:hypothetical protein
MRPAVPRQAIDLSIALEHTPESSAPTRNVPSFASCPITRDGCARRVRRVRRMRPGPRRSLDDLALDAGGVRYSRAGVAVNAYLQSVSNPLVYAAGDCADTDGPALTPVAGYEGRIVAAKSSRRQPRDADIRGDPECRLHDPAARSRRFGRSRGARQRRVVCLASRRHIGLALIASCRRNAFRVQRVDWARERPDLGRPSFRTSRRRDHQSQWLAHHSERRASTRLTRLARRAGTTQASSAASPRVAIVVADVWEFVAPFRKQALQPYLNPMINAQARAATVKITPREVS